MKTVLIMRHAKSDWSQDGPDHERTLNTRGQHDAPRMGRFLGAQNLAVDAVYSSTAVRARSTAEAVREAARWDAPFQTEKGLYLATVPAWIDFLGATKDTVDTLVAIGHNPGVSDLVSELTGESVAMPTSAIAQVELDIQQWSDLIGSSGHRLRNYWYPKGIPADFS